MKSERTKVEFPLWRKKVDSLLFQHNGTTIPKWACRMWDLETVFPVLRARKTSNPKSLSCSIRNRLKAKSLALGQQSALTKCIASYIGAWNSRKSRIEVYQPFLMGAQWVLKIKMGQPFKANPLI